MSTNFPVAKDQLTNPLSTSSTSTVSHSQQHANANDAIEALQTKVGVNNSTDINSLDYKVRHINLPVAGTDFIAFSEKGAPGGVATLDGYGLLNLSQVPFFTNLNANSLNAAQGTYYNLTVDNSFTLNGNAQQINATNLTLTDPMIYMGNNNPADSVDLGLVSSFNDGTYQHTGLVRDASDGKWKLFRGVTDEPGLTINFDQATYATLVAGRFEGDGSGLTGISMPAATAISLGSVYGKTGGTNVSLGQESLRRDNSSTRFNYTTAIGYGVAGENYYSNGSVARLTAIGYKAGAKITGQAYINEGSVIIGDEAVAGTASNPTGSVIIGSKAMSGTNLANGMNSVVIGANTAINAAAVNQSVLIGYNSGNTITGNSGGYNIIIGQYTEPSSPNAHHEITLGNQYMERFRIPGLGIDWTANTIPSNKIIFNDKTGSYTLQASDNHKMIRVDSSTDCTIQIPADTFNTGDEISVQQVGEGLISIQSGMAVQNIQSAAGTNPSTRTQYSALQIICLSSNLFTVIGDIV